jgi:hypothetical protein
MVFAASREHAGQKISSDFAGYYTLIDSCRTTRGWLKKRPPRAVLRFSAQRRRRRSPAKNRIAGRA